MSKWLLRTAFVALTLLGCAGAGWLIGSWLSAPLAGLLFSAAFGLAAMLLADSMRGERVMAWLRSDAHGPAPGGIGVWGEIGAQIERALRRRERSTQLEQQRLAQLMSAVEASPIGVLLLDRRDQIELCSRVAAMHLGLEAERDLQQPITNLVRAPEFVEHMAAPPSTRPVSFASPTGTRVSALVQRYGDGLKLVLTEDITERERAETMRRNFVANDLAARYVRRLDATGPSGDLRAELCRFYRAGQNDKIRMARAA
jgi:two-component system phosphate regulon sensor histidine kinase PhoR